MTDHFIQLYCANCGGAIQVYDDMDHFACGRCGAGMAVERRGGTVVLKPVSPAIQPAQSVTDKAAAAASLRGLQAEAQNLSARRDALKAGRIEHKRVGLLAGAALAVIGFVVLRTGISYLAGLSALLAGFATIIFIRRRDQRAAIRVREIESKLEVLNGRIEDRTLHVRET
jgi:hypothetical protein